MRIRAANAIRRLLDIAVGGGALIVLSPLLASAAVVTALTAGRPVIYRQRRLGRGGHPFMLFKFRTMRDPAPGREGPEHDAARITSVGKRLRATSIDELPSLLNLVRGEIALVGPRPLPVHYWDRFRGDEYERFRVRPGITGLAQIRGRNQLEWSDRLTSDVEYVRSQTLRGDLEIIARTVPMVLRRAGIDEAEGTTMTELPPERP